MSIANELSSEVAADMLARHKDEVSGTNRNKIKAVIVELHSTLQRLTANTRKANRRAHPQTAQPSSNPASTKN